MDQTDMCSYAKEHILLCWRGLLQVTVFFYLFISFWGGTERKFNKPTEKRGKWERPILFYS